MISYLLFLIGSLIRYVQRPRGDYKLSRTSSCMTLHTIASTSQNSEILMMVNDRKLKWCGHVSRSNSMSRRIQRGTVYGTRRKGRPIYMCQDNIAYNGLVYRAIAKRRE